MRTCRKCGSSIKNWVVIGGKSHNLQNRKFCLICSPFGGRNTKKDDPSRVSRSLLNYNNWSTEDKKRHRIKVLERGQKLRLRAISYLGGKCKKCGYNRCVEALVFHHCNPAEKKFGLTAGIIRAHSWEEIKKEIMKCDLLCSICHIELHYELKYGPIAQSAEQDSLKVEV